MATSPAMSRPARRQIAKDKVNGPQPSVAIRGEDPERRYNIYYDRWRGGGRGNTDGKEKAPYRCDPVKDSGRTKGTFNPNAYFCVFFAKGRCPHGEECNWLHRIPSEQDHVDSGMDVFGRERFDEHRDDLGGVGSMQSDSRTLFVGRIGQSPDMHAIAEKHFKAWGDIDRIKVLTDKGVAFVTYQNRLNAEFAKEAMANQSLDHNEILNIRWATGDPNPKVQAINKRKAVEMVQQAIESKLSTEFKEAQHLPGSEDLGLKKRSKQEENNGTEAPTPTLYLGADGQYYYDYGDYGYNHETQQYDPARLDNYSGLVNSGKSKSPAASSILLQDRIKATLLSKAPSLPSTSPSLSKDAKETNLKPATSALGALATYGSDSESSEGE